MIIYAKRTNTNEFKEFVIPPYKGFNCKTFVIITIDTINKNFKAQKQLEFKLSDQEWEVTHQYTFPSTIFYEFL